MKIRLGYVALSKALDNVTSSGTMTYTNYVKENEPKDKIMNIIDKNLNALEQIIIYNIKNNIHFYRATSNLIPLATHQNVCYDYITCFLNKYQMIGKLIRENGMRVDVHPDQYAVLNSMNKEVVNNTFKILEYHYKILEALGIKNKVIVMHAGSSAGGKKAAITRFVNNFNKLPKEIQSCIVVENDDKTFNIKDVLDLCKRINVPMILDYHHFICNNKEEKLEDYIDDIFDTWKNINPKVHFSSPKNKTKKDFRSHHDYINSDDFIHFIDKIKNLNYDVDVMIEAKAKDDALFRLIRELKYKTNYKFIDETSFEV